MAGDGGSELHARSTHLWRAQDGREEEKSRARGRCDGNSQTVDAFLIVRCTVNNNDTGDADDYYTTPASVCPISYAREDRRQLAA